MDFDRYCRAHGNSCADVFFLYVDKDEDLWIYGAGVWAYDLSDRKWHSQWNFSDRGQAHISK